MKEWLILLKRLVASKKKDVYNEKGQYIKTKVVYKPEVSPI
jgi:hypothetical protein